MQLSLSCFVRQLSNARLAARGVGTRLVCGVTHDSRRVEPGVVFCLLPESRGGNPYQAFAAAERGAAAIICEPDTAVPPHLPRLEVTDAHAAYAEAASALAGDSAHRLELLAVESNDLATGGTRRHSSNVSALVARLLRTVGRNVALIGELGCEAGDRRLPGPASRMRAVELHSFLAAHERAGGDSVVVEMTRPTRTNLAGACASSRRLRPSVQALPAAAVLTWRGLRLPFPEGFLLAPLAGRGNALALLEAFQLALAAGASRRALLASLKTLRTTAGFLEPVSAGQPFGVFVDAARTPVEVAALLADARELVRGQGRVLLVLGAAAEFDAGNRAALGRAAAAADRLFLTTDSPRHASVAALSAELLAGAPSLAFIFESNRDRAIAAAIQTVQPGDLVVVAGKAHRAVQEIGGTVLPCDDRRSIFSALAARGYGNGGTEC